MSEPKPVTLVVISSTMVDGRPAVVGEILPDVEFDLACVLTGAGRTRLANDDDIAKAKAGKAKAKAEA